jgi:hypothetical protein
MSLSSLVIALTLAMVGAVEEEAEVEVVAVVENVTNVVKSGISLVHALRQAVEHTAHLAVAMVRKKLGKVLFFCFQTVLGSFSPE